MINLHLTFRFQLLLLLITSSMLFFVLVLMDLLIGLGGCNRLFVDILCLWSFCCFWLLISLFKLLRDGMIDLLGCCGVVWLIIRLLCVLNLLLCVRAALGRVRLDILLSDLGVRHLRLHLALILLVMLGIRRSRVLHDKIIIASLPSHIKNIHYSCVDTVSNSDWSSRSRLVPLLVLQVPVDQFLPHIHEVFLFLLWDVVH